MKKKDLKTLREKTENQLIKLLENKKKEASLVFVKTKAGQEKNLKKYKNLRVEIATILTIIGEKQTIVKEEGVKK